MPFYFGGNMTFQKGHPVYGGFQKGHLPTSGAFKKGHISTHGYKKGHKHSPEVLAKIGEKHKGKHPKTEFKKGMIPWNKGLKGIMNAWNKGKKFPNLSAENSKTWKGGKHISRGYVIAYAPNHPLALHSKYILEHRLVIEKEIGRFLNRIEKVHHINGIKSDNRPENLMAFINQSSHIKFERGHFIKSEEIVFDGRNHIIKESTLIEHNNAMKIAP